MGRYHCCSQLAYRYESITGVNGCQYKEHTVVPENDRDRSILNLVNIASDNNSMMFEAAPSKVPTIGCSTDSWWSGISILPSRSRQGILPALHIEGKKLYFIALIKVDLNVKTLQITDPIIENSWLVNLIR